MKLEVAENSMSGLSKGAKREGNESGGLKWWSFRAEKYNRAG